MSSEFFEPIPGPRKSMSQAASKVVSAHPGLWCEVVIAASRTITGYRIRDRAGQLFGFGTSRVAAWEDAWRRIQEAHRPNGS
jgi:hypothetical protein